MAKSASRTAESSAKDRIKGADSIGDGDNRPILAEHVTDGDSHKEHNATGDSGPMLKDGDSHKEHSATGDARPMLMTEKA